MKRDNFALIIAICLAVSGCGGASGGASPPPPPVVPPPPPPPPTPSPPPSVEREVNPAITNAAINTNLSPHVTLNPDPAVAAKGRLFVMLPGTDAVPRFYRLILRIGAPRGYHVIGLTYPNDDAIGTLCASSAEADCAGLARNEIITGSDTSPLVAVNPANSITGRLVSLLSYLSSAYPNEGWGQYLVGGQPNWSIIMVAGHSQGSGHAAYLAKLQSLDRSVMFSGPADTGLAAGSPAPWYSLPNVTPAARQFGFTHVSDTLANYTLVSRNWDQIGLSAFGASVSVDTQAAPFNNSHHLTTNAAPNPNPTGPTASPTHGAPVADAVTPLTTSGTPLFAPVWNYLVFP